MKTYNELLSCDIHDPVVAIVPVRIPDFLEHSIDSYCLHLHFERVSSNFRNRTPYLSGLSELNIPPELFHPER